MEKITQEKGRWTLDDSPKTVEETLALLEDLVETLKNGVTKESAQN